MSIFNVPAILAFSDIVQFCTFGEPHPCARTAHKLYPKGVVYDTKHFKENKSK